MDQSNLSEENEKWLRALINNQAQTPLDLSDLQKAFEIYQSRKIEDKGADSTFVV